MLSLAARVCSYYYNRPPLIWASWLIWIAGCFLVCKAWGGRPENERQIYSEWGDVPVSHPWGCKWRGLTSFCEEQLEVLGRGNCKKGGREWDAERSSRWAPLSQTQILYDRVATLLLVLSINALVSPRGNIRSNINKRFVFREGHHYYFYY